MVFFFSVFFLPYSSADKPLWSQGPNNQHNYTKLKLHSEQIKAIRWKVNRKHIAFIIERNNTIMTLQEILSKVIMVQIMLNSC